MRGILREWFQASRFFFDNVFTSFTDVVLLNFRSVFFGLEQSGDGPAKTCFAEYFGIPAFVRENLKFDNGLCLPLAFFLNVHQATIEEEFQRRG